MQVEFSLLAQIKPVQACCVAAGFIQAEMVNVLLLLNGVYPAIKEGAPGVVVENSIALMASVSTWHWLGPTVIKLFKVIASVPEAAVTVSVAE